MTARFSLSLPCGFHSRAACYVQNVIIIYSVFLLSSDSPVLWVRIDPEVTWLRQVTFEQPDYMWQYQLRHERDVTAQSEVHKTMD